MSQRLPAGWSADIRLGIDACPETMIAASRIRHPRLHTYYFPEHVGPYIIFNSLACSNPPDVLVRFDAFDDVMLGDYLLSQLNEVGSASTPAILQTWSIYVDQELRPVSARLASGKTAAPDGRRNDASDVPVYDDVRRVAAIGRLSAVAMPRRYRIHPALALGRGIPQDRARASLSEKDARRLFDSVG